tara:strand:+ start:175 stop:1578 length:1404 start_codon:yes stop_codon:yes gene_type:complete
MAKKQGINYNPNTALIRGAAAAYQDYDNMPGMYSGLDKIVEGGIGLVDDTVEDLKKEQEEKEAIEKAWNQTADQVLLNSGALGDKLYNTTDSHVAGLKKLYLEGINEKDDAKRMQAMRGLQAHSTWVQDHKQMNLDYANMINGKDQAGNDVPELSNYFKNTAEGRGKAHIIETIMGQKYDRTSMEDGETIFHFKDISGGDIKISSKEYNEMAIPRDYKTSESVENIFNGIKNMKNYDAQSVKNKIETTVPTDREGLVATLNDPINGQSLTQMMMNSTTLETEILAAVTGREDLDLPESKGGDGNPKTLTATEKANFIKAVTDPSYLDGKFWNEENSRKILKDQLFNGINNRHTKLWENVSDKSTPLSELQKIQEKKEKLANQKATATYNRLWKQASDDLTGSNRKKGQIIEGIGGKSVQLKSIDGREYWVTYLNGDELDKKIMNVKATADRNILDFLFDAGGKPIPE